MLEVKYQRDAFYVKGSLNLGYIGTFKNENWLKDAEIAKDKTEGEEIAIYGMGHIVVIDTLEQIQESLKNKGSWAVLEEYTKSDSADDIAMALTSYYNAFEAKIEQNIVEFNDTFLYHALEFFTVGNPNFLNFRKRLSMYYLDAPCDGTVEKPEFEKYVRYGFSEKQEEGKRIMLDKILESILPDIVTLADADMAFQCHDNLLPDSMFLKNAYAELDWDLNFIDWNN